MLLDSDFRPPPTFSAQLSGVHDASSACQCLVGGAHVVSMQQKVCAVCGDALGLLNMRDLKDLPLAPFHPLLHRGVTAKMHPL